MPSWRTTSSGILLGVGMILSVLLPKFGVFAGTEVDDLIGGALLIIGAIWLGTSARDDVVTSEGNDARNRRPQV